jgi:hypothetical protein
LLLALALSGCSGTPGGLGAGDHEVVTLDGPVTLLGAGGLPIVRNPDGTVCYGPMPDVSLDEDASGVFSSFSLNDGQIETALGGRNPNVLVTRDIFFQACLAESRLNMTRQERVQLFRKTLDAVVQINSQSLDGEAVTDDTPMTTVQLPGLTSQQKDPGSSY